MKKSEIKTRVLDVLYEQCEITRDIYASRKNDEWRYLSVDSLDEVELIMAMEEEFGIEVKDEDALEIRTPRQALKFAYATLVS